MVVANAVAALSEINEASPTGRPLIEMNAATINKLLTALNECTEWGQVFILDSLSNYAPKVANIYLLQKTSWLGPKKQDCWPKVIIAYLARVLWVLQHP